MISPRRPFPLPVLALAALGLAACRSPLAGRGEAATGSLVILLPDSAASRASSRGALKGVVATVDAWHIAGEGPGEAAFDRTIAMADAATEGEGATIVLKDLLLGPWSFIVTGLDADGAAVMESRQDVTVVVSEPSSPQAVAFTMAWTDKALVARLSFDEAVKDDKRRVSVAPSGPLTPAPSSLANPTIDGQGCLALTGTEYVDASAIELGDRFSVSMWIRVSGTVDMVLASSRRTAGGDGFTLYRGGSGTIRLETTGGSNLETGNVAAVTNTWYHVAFAMDTVTGRVSIFVNGILQASAEVVTIDASLPIRLGGSFYEAYPFIGRMDDVRVYSGALGADDAAALYADGYFSGGRGTADSPYLVATPMDLFNVRYFASACFRQTAGLDLSQSDTTKDWTPIASFTGSYDGGGKTISKLVLTAGNSGTGLFETIAGGAVRDLTLDGVSHSGGTTSLGSIAGTVSDATLSGIALKDVKLLSGADYAGGLAGRITGSGPSTVSGVTIDSPIVEGTQYVGGLTGAVDASGTTTISGVVVTGAAVLGSSTRVGGLVGQTSSATILRDSSVSGSALSSNASAQYLGGLVGYMFGASERCVADVAVGPAGGTTFATAQFLGGFAGQIQDPATLSDCRASGSVTGNYTSGSATTGGFAGYIRNMSAGTLTLSGCSASGPVSCSSGNAVGGFAGLIAAASGNVSLDGCSASGGVVVSSGSYIGGFAGSVAGSASWSATLSACSASGAVAAPSCTWVGGFVGVAKTRTTIETSRATGAVSGQASLGGFAGILETPPTTIRRSYATGTVTGTGNSLGGFVGIIQGMGGTHTIENCYSRGGVTAASGASGVAGFAGRHTIDGHVILTSYSACDVENGTGAFIGATTANGTVTVSNTCHWDPSAFGHGALANPSNAPVTGTVVGPSAADLRSGAAPSGWSASDWSFPAGSYPTLIGNP